MIYQNVELHNIEQVIPSDNGAVLLRRVPESVRQHLNPGCQYQMTRFASGEIRFVTDDLKGEVTLSIAPEAWGDEVRAVIFYGGFQHGQPIYIRRGQPRTLEISPPDRIARMPAGLRGTMPFGPNVIRIQIAGEPVAFHGAAGQGLRPPRPAELPRLRLLTYGTSITHGAAATLPHLCYAAQAARRLGADLINLGSGGSAHCEPELADYIAGRTDWHIAALALSVNMMGFSNEEFYERVAYMVKTVAAADTSRPVACITLYPYFADWNPDEQPQAGTPAEKRQLLRDAVAAAEQPNLHLIEGEDILTDPSGLTGDLIHPGDHGMIQMGQNLAARLAPLLQGAGRQAGPGN